MEIVTEITQSQFAVYVPIALAIVGLIAVFAFGFGTAQQPKFKLTSLDDRKTAAKKRKTKDKKAPVNGHIASEKSPSKDKKSPVKEASETRKEKKSDASAKKPEEKRKTNEPQEQAKKRPAKKQVAAQKPDDFDEGDWEKVLTKADRKKKSDQSPSKKEKKVKKSEKNDAEPEKTEKEETPVEEKIESKPEPVKENAEEKIEESEAVAPVVEEKKEKKKEKKPKREVKDAEGPAISEVNVVAEEKSVEVPAAPVFDELGDTWTETKQPKKGKKKTRRDN
ncbi:uncharacterized protein DDB_G0286299-like [Cylas formicarius]|uniref:uncharacterized protein DDB_G0286299-like n=1 Tax=Cylas formicarius TaxID=197179 RepID=UPI00295860AF|nr:uncharacterized protein DDB_G0286299-like [Cylas formicarius]